jgi:hypothetical protein
MKTSGNRLLKRLLHEFFATNIKMRPLQKLKPIDNGLENSITDPFRTGDTYLLRCVSFGGVPIGDTCVELTPSFFLTLETHVVITRLYLHVPKIITFSSQKVTLTLSPKDNYTRPLSLEDLVGLPRSPPPAARSLSSES